MLLNVKQYVDIPFFITKNPHTKDFNVIKNINAIKSSVKNICLTISGERPFNSKFGTLINLNTAFNDTQDMKEGIIFRNKIYTSLYLHENRIKDLEISMKDNTINIQFSTKTDNQILEMNLKNNQ